jgi:hypothetical protein
LEEHDLETKGAERRRAGPGLSTARRGAARSLGLVLGSLVALIAGLVWWSRREPAGTPSEAVPVAPELRPVAAEAYLEPPPVRSANEPDPVPRPPPLYPSELFDPERYRGAARVEVHVTTPPGVALPERWTLAFEPSPVLFGAEHAVARTVEVEGGASSTVVPDVQLGGYLVRALAPDLEAPAQPLELAKPDELDVVLRFDFHRPGFLTGRVVDAAGAPVAGIRVVVEQRDGGAARELVTDASGVYVASPLLEGEYRVLVGAPGATLAKADDVSFSAPSLHMPDLVTPALGLLVVRVVDAAEQPVAGARIEGLGRPSGPILAESDLDGLARVPNAAAGTVHLYARHPTGGSGDADGLFEPGTERQITVEIRP